MDDATLAEIEKRHQPMVLDGKSQCSWCYEYEHAWPCTIGLLLAEVRRLRAEAAAKYEAGFHDGSEDVYADFVNFVDEEDNHHCKQCAFLAKHGEPMDDEEPA